MTFLIERLFIEQHQAYTIHLDNQQVMSAVSHVYRIFNNQEKDITTLDETLIQYSDTNHQVILKFLGATQLVRYGVNINYRSVQMSE